MFPLMRADPGRLRLWPINGDKGDLERKSGFPLDCPRHVAKIELGRYSSQMEPVSYRFLVARDSAIPVIGALHGWVGGNAAALRHLEKQYPDWTQITIQKANETTTQSSRESGNFRSSQKSRKIGGCVCQVPQGVA